MGQKLLLKIENVYKSFGGVKALKNVSLDIYEKQVLGLVGANGAGKSTLLKIIGGVLKPDEGRLSLEGAYLNDLNPHMAQQKGIISVYQELNLFLYKTVAENLFIGKENKTRLGFINWKITNDRAKSILDELGLDIKPDTVVSKLSIAQQHLVEISRAIKERPKLLLLDEPTSALSEKEIQWLFRKIKELVQGGTTVIYVSHRLDEVAELCDRCVVMRDGENVKELSGDFNKDSIIRHMVGHDVTFQKTDKVEISSEVVFECRNLRSKKVKGVSFQVKKGEILGIAGLVGAGRTELLQTIYGIIKPTSGTIVVNGVEKRIRNTQDALKSKIALIPEDRKNDGLFMNENVRFNISIETLKNRAKAGIIREKEEKRETHNIAQNVMLDTGRMEHAVKLLSGGNQQKTVIARKLLVNADILLLDEPTRGVDVGAREEIYEIIKNVVKTGKSVILVSSDWEELIFLSDRLLVMAEGRITGELSGDEINEKNIMHLSTIENIEESRKKPDKKVVFKADRFFKNNNAVLVTLICLLYTIGLLTNSSFRTWTNVRNLMGQITPTLLLTFGQLMVLIIGGIDLSNGTQIAFTSVLGLSIILQNPDNIYLAIILMFCSGLLVGTINGLMVVKYKVNSLVTTLGMSIILSGVSLVITNQPIGPAPRVFVKIANKDIFGIPNVLFIIILFITFFAIMIKYTPLGRRFFAVGENETYAHWAGLPVIKTKFIAYIICSLMSVFTALFMFGRTGAADPTFGQDMAIDSIACVLIGGGSFSGGKGSIAGAVYGVILVQILNNLMSLMGVGLWSQKVLQGTLLLAIIISYQVRQKKLSLE